MFFSGSVIESTTLPITLILSNANYQMQLVIVVDSISFRLPITQLPISGCLAPALPLLWLGGRWDFWGWWTARDVLAFWSRLGLPCGGGFSWEAILERIRSSLIRIWFGLVVFLSVFCCLLALIGRLKCCIRLLSKVFLVLDTAQSRWID